MLSNFAVSAFISTKRFVFNQWFFSNCCNYISAPLKEELTKIPNFGNIVTAGPLPLPKQVLYSSRSRTSSSFTFPGHSPFLKVIPAPYLFFLVFLPLLSFLQSLCSSFVWCDQLNFTSRHLIVFLISVSSLTLRNTKTTHWRNLEAKRISE
jgi:hypothetical protein